MAVGRLWAGRMARGQDAEAGKEQEEGLVRISDK
jgi:hypothetical protein